jgi:hypothetical protein
MSSDKPNDAPVAAKVVQTCWHNELRECDKDCVAFHEGGRTTTCEFIYLLSRIEKHFCPPLPTAAPPRAR